MRGRLRPVAGYYRGNTAPAWAGYYVGAALAAARPISATAEALGGRPQGPPLQSTIHIARNRTTRVARRPIGYYVGAALVAARLISATTAAPGGRPQGPPLQRSCHVRTVKYHNGLTSSSPSTRWHPAARWETVAALGHPQAAGYHVGAALMAARPASRPPTISSGRPQGPPLQRSSHVRTAKYPDGLYIVITIDSMASSP